jgi:hypothetical protein
VGVFSLCMLACISVHAFTVCHVLLPEPNTVPTSTAGKMANFELQTRVPFMIRAPFMPQMAGRSTTAMTELGTLRDVG